MKKSLYTEQQIIRILKQHEARMKTAELCLYRGLSAARFSSLACHSVATWSCSKRNC